MNLEQLKAKALEAKRLSDAATPEIWALEPELSRYPHSVVVKTSRLKIAVADSKKDMEFIAASRTLLPELADAVIELSEHRQGCCDSREAQADKHRRETIMWAEQNLKLKEKLAIATEQLKFLKQFFDHAAHDSNYYLHINYDAVKEIQKRIEETLAKIEEKE